MTSSEETAPYGGAPAAPSGSDQIKRIRTHHLQQMKEQEVGS